MGIIDNLKDSIANALTPNNVMNSTLARPNQVQEYTNVSGPIEDTSKRFTAMETPQEMPKPQPTQSEMFNQEIAKHNQNIEDLYKQAEVFRQNLNHNDPAGVKANLDYVQERLNYETNIINGLNQVSSYLDKGYEYQSILEAGYDRGNAAQLRYLNPTPQEAPQKVTDVKYNPPQTQEDIINTQKRLSSPDVSFNVPMPSTPTITASTPTTIQTSRNVNLNPFNQANPLAQVYLDNLSKVPQPKSSNIFNQNNPLIQAIGNNPINYPPSLNDNLKFGMNQVPIKQTYGTVSEIRTLNGLKDVSNSNIYYTKPEYSYNEVTRTAKDIADLTRSPFILLGKGTDAITNKANYQNPYLTATIPQRQTSSQIMTTNGLKDIGNVNQITYSKPSLSLGEAVTGLSELGALAVMPEAAVFTYLGTQATPNVLNTFNKDLTASERISSGINAGLLIGVPLGLKGLSAATSKTYKLSRQYSTIPDIEGTIFNKQVNPVVELYDNYGNLIGTKYNYEFKSLVPEVKGTTVSKPIMTEEPSFLGKLFGKESKSYDVDYFSNPKAYKKAIDMGFKPRDLELKYPSPKVISTSGKGVVQFGDDLLNPMVVIRANQKVTPKSLVIEGTKTRSFNPFEFDIKSKGAEVFTKDETTYLNSLSENKKSFIETKGKFKGETYTKTNQFGKTTETFKQSSALKNMGSTDLNEFISKINPEKNSLKSDFSPYETADVSKQFSLSKKISPNQRKINTGSSNIVSSNLKDPLVISNEPSFKVTKDLDLPSGRKSNGIDNGLTTVQETKPLTLVKDSQKSLMEIRSKIAKDTIDKMIPKTENIKTPKVKEVASVSKTLGDNKFASISKVSGKIGSIGLTGKIDNLNNLGKIPSLGVSNNRFKSLEDLGTKNESNKEKSNQKNNNLLVVKQKEELKESPVTGLIFGSSFDTSTGIKPNDKIDEAISPVSSTSLKTDTATSTTFKQPLPISPYPYNPTKPDPNNPVPNIKPNIKLTRFISTKSEIGPRRINTKKSTFTTEIRRKGKFIGIANSSSFDKALNIGKIEARKTLATSIRIKKNGRLLSLNPSQEFRKSKSYKDPFSIIQSRSSRLGSFTEKKEIQLARKGVLSLA